MDDKIIVTNRGALVAKYGRAGVAKIKAAVAALIAADAARGIKTRLVNLDDDTTMKKFKGSGVTSANSARQNKDAIDAIFQHANPEYLLILGSIDVVPHQDLVNPAYAPPSDDPDPIAYGDLPYACDAPYSRDIATFKGPTRVVGRLPDLTGAKTPAHLLKLLGIATKYKSRDAAAYAGYFGLSTVSWHKSTELSLFNIFGSSKAVTLSPPSGPRQPKAKLASLAHFINCHGGDSDPRFYGENQQETKQPPSLSSTTITNTISNGTVAAMECCFGAQLYNSIMLALPIPICQNYLAQGAYGYFGSSTIAYGPSEGNSAADLITQYFLMAVLDGASVGRATLIARQRYVQQTSELDPMDLKTLGQFSLLGDPSIHPVAVTDPTSVPKGVDVHESRRLERRERRAKLRAAGELLRATKPTASHKDRKPSRSPTVRRALANIAREAGIGRSKGFTAYAVKAPPSGRSRGAKAVPAASRYYVAIHRPRKNARLVAAVAKEVAGRIIGYRIYQEK